MLALAGRRGTRAGVGDLVVGSLFSSRPVQDVGVKRGISDQRWLFESF